MFFKVGVLIILRINIFQHLGTTKKTDDVCFYNERKQGLNGEIMENRHLFVS